MGTRFSGRPDRPWGPPSLLYNGYRVFPGGKVWRPGRAADHSPPSCTAGMEEWSYTSTHPLGHTGPVTGSLYLLVVVVVVVVVVVRDWKVFGKHGYISWEMYPTKSIRLLLRTQVIAGLLTECTNWPFSGNCCAQYREWPILGDVTRTVYFFSSVCMHACMYVYVRHVKGHRQILRSLNNGIISTLVWPVTYIMRFLSPSVYAYIVSEVRWIVIRFPVGTQDYPKASIPERFILLHA